MSDDKKHSPEFVAYALERLAANAGNVKKTAEELSNTSGRHIARSVLTSWRDGTRRRSDSVQALVEQQGPVADGSENAKDYDRLARKWTDLADMATDAARRRVAETKSFKELIVGGAVATDKALLLRGRPSSRTELTISFHGDPKRPVRDMNAIEGEWREENGSMVNGDHIYLAPGQFMDPGALGRLADAVADEVVGASRGGGSST